MRRSCFPVLIALVTLFSESSLLLAARSGSLNVTRELCWPDDLCADNGRPPGKDALCFTGNLRSEHASNHDKTPGAREVHLLRMWPLLTKQFPSADILFVMKEMQCDYFLGVVGKLSRMEPTRRFYIWCHTAVITRAEQYFIDNSPVDHTQVNLVFQWREVAACNDMVDAALARYPGYSYARLTRLRYDSNICALDVAALPANAFATQVTSIFDATGEYLVHDQLLTGPATIMRRVFYFYHWFLDPYNWRWWSVVLQEYEPRLTNPYTGVFPRRGLYSEELLKYYMFSYQLPLKRVPPSVLYVKLGRSGSEACAIWPGVGINGWPAWKEVKPTECTACWSFDGPFAAALLELFQRGMRPHRVATVLDLGAGVGVYAKQFMRTGTTVFVSVDWLKPEILRRGGQLLWWQADITEPLNGVDRIWRLAVFRKMAAKRLPVWNILDVNTPDLGYTWVMNIDYVPNKALNDSLSDRFMRIHSRLRFDWALALGIDNLPAIPIAENVQAHANGVIATGSAAWLDTFGAALVSFRRLRDVESDLRMFAGTTCCSSHREVRVYAREIPAAAERSTSEALLAQWLPEFDPWKTTPSSTAPRALALWLQAVRAQRLGQSSEERGLLFKWFAQVDWAEVHASELSAFDVPVSGIANVTCQESCSHQARNLGAGVARDLQLFSQNGGIACMVGCLRGIRQARSRRLRPSLQFLGNDTLRFRFTAAGLYAYNVVGAMV